MVTDNYSTFLGSCLGGLKIFIFFPVARFVDISLNAWLNTEPYTIINRSSAARVFRTKMKEEFVVHELGVLESLAVRTLPSTPPPSYFKLTQNKKKRPVGSNRII